MTPRWAMVPPSAADLARPAVPDPARFVESAASADIPATRPEYEGSGELHRPQRCRIVGEPRGEPAASRGRRGSGSLVSPGAVDDIDVNIETSRRVDAMESAKNVVTSVARRSDE